MEETGTLSKAIIAALQLLAEPREGIWKDKHYLAAYWVSMAMIRYKDRRKGRG